MRLHRMSAAVVVIFLLVAVPGWDRSSAADEPLKEAGLQVLLELKLDDEVIVARIKKAGLAFAGDEAALQRLAKSGASDAVLSAVREVGAPKPAPSAAPAPTESARSRHRDAETTARPGVGAA